jgi:hypothetical protein
MAQSTLVNSDLDEGAALVRALDAARFPVMAAMWLYMPEHEDWKLTIASPEAKSLIDGYVKMSEIAKSAGLDDFDLSRTRLVPPSDKTVSTLSRARRLEGLGGVRITGNMINGVFVEDAYVYRAAA